MLECTGMLRMDGGRVPHGEKSVQNRNTSELAESAVFLRALLEHENLRMLLLTIPVL